MKIYYLNFGRRKLSDDAKADRAFSDLPIARAMRVTYQIKLIQNNENNKSKIAARYEYARRCFLYDERVPNGINRPAAGNKQQKRMASNLQKDVSRGNKRADGQRLTNDVEGGSATPSLGEYKFIKKCWCIQCAPCVPRELHRAFQRGTNQQVQR